MKSRLGTILLLIAFLMASASAAVFYMGRAEEQNRRVFLEAELQKLTAAKDALEQERDELTKTKEDLENKLNDATTQAKNLADQLAQEKRASEALTDEVAAARKDASDTKGRLDAEKKEKASLAEEVAKVKQSYQALSNELVTLRQAKEALEKRVKEMLTAQASEAEKIVVKPTSGTTTPASTTTVAPISRTVAPPVPSSVSSSRASSLEGKVLVVNREFNFVVVNLGSKDGLKTGVMLQISRGEKPLGKAQVERVYDNMAAATLLTEEQKGQAKEGDFVRVTS